MEDISVRRFSLYEGDIGMKDYDIDLLEELRKELDLVCISDIPARCTDKEIKCMMQCIPEGIYSKETMEEALNYCRERRQLYNERLGR